MKTLSVNFPPAIRGFFEFLVENELSSSLSDSVRDCVILGLEKYIRIMHEMGVNVDLVEIEKKEKKKVLKDKQREVKEWKVMLINE